MRRTEPVEPRSRAEAAASFVETVAGILDEKRAEDVVWLDVSGVTDVADDFLIATILNARQGGAILDACDREAKRFKKKRLGVEGGATSSWILLDYGSLVVHLFLPEQRSYYALEHLWADAKKKPLPGAADPGGGQR